MFPGSGGGGRRHQKSVRLRNSDSFMYNKKTRQRFSRCLALSDHHMSLPTMMIPIVATMPVIIAVVMPVMVMTVKRTIRMVIRPVVRPVESEFEYRRSHHHWRRRSVNRRWFHIHFRRLNIRRRRRSNDHRGCRKRNANAKMHARLGGCSSPE